MGLESYLLSDLDTTRTEPKKNRTEFGRNQTKPNTIQKLVKPE